MGERPVRQQADHQHRPNREQRVDDAAAQPARIAGGHRPAVEIPEVQHGQDEAHPHAHGVQHKNHSAVAAQPRRRLRQHKDEVQLEGELQPREKVEPHRGKGGDGLATHHGHGRQRELHRHGRREEEEQPVRRS